MSLGRSLQSVFRELVSSLPDNAQIEAIGRFEELCQRSEAREDLVEQVLIAERDRSYFDDGHFKSTLHQKSDFDWRTARWMCQVLSTIFPPSIYDHYGLFGSRNDALVKTGTDNLRQRGYFILPCRIPANDVRAIVDGLGDVAFRVKATGDVLNGYRQSNIRRPKGNTVWVRDQQDVLRIPQVQQLAMDPTILTIVQNYLECPPIHVQANCWWTINYQTNNHSLSSDAQLFHQDKEFIRFVKVFVYLNDVDDSNGPHQYVAGSAKDYKDHVPEGYAISQRLSDDDLRQQYPADRFVRIQGQAGTIVLEDTSGFHKGEPVLKGHRLMLQLEYCCSLYFNPVPSFSWDGTMPAFRAFAARHPRWALNYDDERYQAHRNRLAQTMPPPQPKLRERVRNMFATVLDHTIRRQSA